MPAAAIRVKRRPPALKSQGKQLYVFALGSISSDDAYSGGRRRPEPVNVNRVLRALQV